MGTKVWAFSMTQIKSVTLAYYFSIFKHCEPHTRLLRKPGSAWDLVCILVIPNSYMYMSCLI